MPGRAHPAPSARQYSCGVIQAFSHGERMISPESTLANSATDAPALTMPPGAMCTPRPRGCVVVHDGPGVDDAAHTEMHVRADIGLRQDDAARLRHGAGADRGRVTDKHRCGVARSRQSFAAAVPAGRYRPVPQRKGVPCAGWRGQGNPADRPRRVPGHCHPENPRCPSPRPSASHSAGCQSRRGPESADVLR